MVTTIKRKLVQIGDSLGIIVTSPVCELLGLNKGDLVEIENLKKVVIDGN